MKLISYFLTFLFLSGSSIFADAYHYYTSLYGDRAAGMAGAYTAISDNPSGLYYNPAGVAIAPDNYLTVSSNMYNETIKRYQNVFGMGADYTRTSRSFNPNYIATLKKISSLTFGIAIINPISEKYDQADQFNLPVYFPTFLRSQIDYTEQNQNLQAGLGVAYAVNEKLSFGLTVFGFNDSSKIVLEQIIEKKDNSFIKATYKERRNTSGVIPVFGFLYNITNKLSFGATIRKTIVSRHSQIISGDRISDRTNQAQDLILYYNTTNLSVSTAGGGVYLSQGLPVSVPEIFEHRAGIAHFFSERLIMSADVIHFDPYRKKRNRNEWQPFTNELTIRDSRDPELDREEVWNYAVGLEFFINPMFSVRLGTYSNQANTRSYNWKRSVGEFILADNQLNYIQWGENGYYYPQALQPQVRYENVDIRGYSFGLSIESAVSAISLTYVYEYGRGSSQISASQLPQSLIYRNRSIYIVASSHQ